MTEKSKMDGTGLEALGEVLDRFGSDRTRWPAPVRRSFAGLLASSDEARQRLREAEALDRLLDLAPEPEIDTRALADRIMAAVEADVPARAAAAPRRAPWAVFDRRRAADAAEAHWPAGALLAASLVLGAVFGVSGTFVSTDDPLVAEASYETDVDSSQIALDSDAIALFEEDFL